MINNNRIVPIMKIDRLSQIGETLKLIGTAFTKLTADDVDGNFTVTGTGDVGNLLADQPAVTVDFADGVTAGVVYFIPAYNFAGFTVNGAATTYSGTVNADGATLYTATLADSAITVTQITP